MEYSSRTSLDLSDQRDQIWESQADGSGRAGSGACPPARPGRPNHRQRQRGSASLGVHLLPDAVQCLMRNDGVDRVTDPNPVRRPDVAPVRSTQAEGRDKGWPSEEESPCFCQLDWAHFDTLILAHSKIGDSRKRKIWLDTDSSWSEAVRSPEDGGLRASRNRCPRSVNAPDGHFPACGELEPWF